MFAIIETGGKQYRVEEGDVLEIELIETGKIDKNKNIFFSDILLIGGEQVKIGQPLVEDITVRAKILDEFLAPKIIVFKKKSKKTYKRTRGHRQKLHRIQIEKIEQVVKKKEQTKRVPAATTKKDKAAKTEDLGQKTPAKKAKPAVKAKTGASSNTTKKKASSESKTTKTTPKKKSTSTAKSTKRETE